ncbi:GCN5-related N-acetyltransferas-like protein, partial [Plenodomus tracheiphilus IPT5]
MPQERAEMAIPFIRAYDSTRDLENGLHVYYTTVDPGLDFEPARTIGSYLWYRPYVSLTPDTCHVLDDGTGRIVGYCIGTADTASFAQHWREVFTQLIDPMQVPKPEIQTDDPLMEGGMVKEFRASAYNAHCSMLQDWPQTLQQYPAHMHIDILPEYQRRGYGRALINAFFQSVKSMGAHGVHLDMVKTNTNGLAFYERIGFQRCPQILDGGASGESGVDGIVLTLVKDL